MYTHTFFHIVILSDLEETEFTQFALPFFSQTTYSSVYVHRIETTFKIEGYLSLATLAYGWKQQLTAPQTMAVRSLAL